MLRTAPARIAAITLTALGAGMAVAGCGSADSTADDADSTPTTTASSIPTSSAPPAETSLEAQVRPYCPKLMAALHKIPALDPTDEQNAGLKRALEGGVRASATGAAAAEIESWYTTTTDLAVAAFGGGDDFTKKWAEWTMGTKVSIQAACES